MMAVEQTLVGVAAPLTLPPIRMSGAPSASMAVTPRPGDFAG